MADYLSGVDRDNPSSAIGRDLMHQFFYSIGLGDPSVIGVVDQLFAAGVKDPDQILFALRDNAAVQARFPLSAIDAYNRKTGQNLSYAGYVALENSYKEKLSQSGLPQDFIDHYTTPDQLSGFIARDVSADELQSRVSNAKAAASSMDPNTRKMLYDYYGVDVDHAAAYFLDPTIGGDILDKSFKAVQFGGAAANAGLKIGKDTAEMAAGNGLSLNNSPQLKSVGDQAGAAHRLANIYNDSITDDDLVKEAFNLDGAADVTKKKKSLASKERAAFSGSSGANSGSLTQKATAV